MTAKKQIEIVINLLENLPAFVKSKDNVNHQINIHSCIQRLNDVIRELDRLENMLK